MKIVKITLFVCIFSVSLSCVSRHKLLKSQSHHNLAISLIQKCEFAKALKELQEAARLKPLDPDLHHSLGLVYFQFKKYQKATDFLQKALKLRPKFTAAQVDLARSLIEINSTGLAIQHLTEAKEDLTYTSPENIYANLGLAYYRQKQFHKAQKYFSVSRKMKAKACIVNLYYAKSLYFLNRFKDALAVFESIKTSCAKKYKICALPNFESYFFSALSYYKLGALKKAKQNMQTFLSKDKDSSYQKEAIDWMQKWTQK